jgi:hypothetical protein
MRLADSGRMDEVDNPFIDALAQSFLDVMAKVEKPKETISII